MGKKLKEVDRMIIKRMYLLLLIITVFTIGANQVYAGQNPSREEVWNESVKLGKNYMVPPEIIYILGYAESEFRQFDKNGKPFAYRGTYGIMQVLPKYLDFPVDLDKLKNDWRYNMEVGVKILLTKWDMQYNEVTERTKPTSAIPKIGDGNRMVLESWYFAMWAYNHWGGFNNPNTRKATTYQERVAKLAKDELGIEVTLIPQDLLPKKGLPKAGKVFKYPEPVHYSMINDSDSLFIPKFLSNRNNIKNQKYILMVN